MAACSFLVSAGGLAGTGLGLAGDALPGTGVIGVARSPVGAGRVAQPARMLQRQARNRGVIFICEREITAIPLYTRIRGRRGCATLQLCSQNG